MHQQFSEHFYNHIAPPPEPIKESAVLAEPKKEKTIQENSKFTTRPFDAQRHVSKFTDIPFIKSNHQDSEHAEKKNKQETKTGRAEIIQPIDSELLAYYFMELLPKQQDDLLVEHEIIVPDKIRNNLKKMSDFIAEKTASDSGFIPEEKILDLLKNNHAGQYLA
ncbi:MAG: hypothetical protein PHW24_03950 [Candidatus Moranbacteria bacterium]|nr:hypothetical protein [Candidatus Moranbacteria bacterium]